MQIVKHILSLKYVSILLLMHFNTKIDIVLNVYWDMIQKVDIYEYVRYWIGQNKLWTLDEITAQYTFKSIDDYHQWLADEPFSFNEAIRMTLASNTTVLCMIRSFAAGQLSLTIRTVGNNDDYIEATIRSSNTIYRERIRGKLLNSMVEIYHIEFWTKLFTMMDKFIKNVK